MRQRLNICVYVVRVRIPLELHSRNGTPVFNESLANRMHPTPIGGKNDGISQVCFLNELRMLGNCLASCSGIHWKPKRLVEFPDLRQRNCLDGKLFRQINQAMDVPNQSMTINASRVILTSHDRFLMAND